MRCIKLRNTTKCDFVMSIDDFIKTGKISDGDLYYLLTNDDFDEDIKKAAVLLRKQVYDNGVFLRGLIEISNFCKNDCYYCGIRCSNIKVERYRLDLNQILNCCRNGYELGLRTFVLQGGEDSFFNDDYLCQIIEKIRAEFPDCAITLSVGEKSYDSYKAYFDAGANRYLLRHETANNEHYGKLHPEKMSLNNRIRCLYDLKEIGYQVGAGFMVGSPYQTAENLCEDIRFLEQLQPDMIGIGPFLTQKDTPFADKSNGSFELTIKLISILRIIFPHALIPATTALGTISPSGREEGILAGSNVVMPNLTPEEFREKYALYEKKIHTGAEAAEGIKLLDNNLKNIGYHIVYDRGDVRKDINVIR